MIAMNTVLVRVKKLSVSQHARYALTQQRAGYTADIIIGCIQKLHEIKRTVSLEEGRDVYHTASSSRKAMPSSKRRLALLMN